MQTGNITYGSKAAIAAWDRELDELYAAITGRGSFRYDPGSDPLYAAYTDRALTNGRMAMHDTVGRASALTGGYASSYAQAVGQQQYGEYLRSLSEAMPEFYELAYRQWQDEGRLLGEQYDRIHGRRADAVQAEQTAYDRSRDAVADARYAAEQAYRRSRDALSDERYAAEQEYRRSRDAAADERYAAEQEYRRSRDAVADERYADQTEYDRGRDAAADERRQEQTEYDRGRDALSDERYDDRTDYDRQQDSYNALVRLITASGYRPTDAELAAAGLSREAADALAEQFLRANKLLPEQQRPVYVVTGGTKKSTGTGRSSRSGSGSSGSSSGSSRRGGGANDRDARLN